MKSNNLVAHRGYPARYPENTLIGYQAAVAAGARYIETDILLTADKVPVLFHDRTMQRLCNHDGAIHQYTADELSQFKASDFDHFGYRYAQNPITRLDELVVWLNKQPTVTAFIEIKRVVVEQLGAEHAIPVILDSLQPAARQCIVISYSMRALAMVRKLGWTQIGAVVDDWKGHQHPTVKKLEPKYFFCDHETLPRFGRLEIPNTRIVVYETVDPVLASKLMARGVDLVETFAIKEMIAALSDKRLA